MRVLHVTNEAGLAGAGIAAVRLHDGLRKLGIDSAVLSTDLRRNGISNSRTVQFGNSWKERLWRRWRLRQLRQMRRQSTRAGREALLPDLSCYGMALLKAFESADVLHFHNVINLLDYPYVLPRLRRDVPVVWTLHDANPATGGCIYPLDCDRLNSECGSCAQLGHNQMHDLSTAIWRRKCEAYSQLKAQLHFVTPSEWLAGVVRRSTLLSRFPVQTIANGLDTNHFLPHDQQSAKRQLGLNPDHPAALFIASRLDDPRKGLRHLLGALPNVSSRFPNLQVLSVGKLDQRVDWPGSVRQLGSISDETKMAEIYSAADLLIIPSEADNLPNVILEAMACGTPAVGFAVGGIPEAIKAGETGLLAAEINATSLAAVICQMLETLRSRSLDWRQQCRLRAVREFDHRIQASRHRDAYKAALAN